MILIFNVAKSIKDNLDNCLERINSNLYSSKEKFEIGISDSDLLKDSIGFELSVSLNESYMKKSDNKFIDLDDDGLIISSYLSYYSLPEDDYTRSIHIEELLMRANGVILESKIFKFSQYNDDNSAERIISDALDYLTYLATILADKLINDYINE
jgi:hypothetical protein